MASINEIEQWDEGIYQLEKNDPVEGGEDGIDNVPHKHLANRTKWLKKQVEDLQAEDIALDTRITDAVEIVSKRISPVASHTIQNMNSISISNTKNKMAHDVLLYKGQTVTDANGETLVFNAVDGDILPYKGTFWNGARSTITLNYYTDESETTTASIKVLDQTSFVNLGVGSIDFTQSNNGTGYYHDRENTSGIGGDCKIVNDSGDSRFIGTIALPEDKFIVDVRFKDRNSTSHWSNYDGLRGVNQQLYTSASNKESFNANRLNSFNSSGIIVGDDIYTNAKDNNFRLEYTVYTHIVAGDTEQGKPYIYAWNPITNDVLGLFQGSGQVGHKVPMPFKVDYCEFKNTDTTDTGVIYYGDKDNLLYLYSGSGSVAKLTANGTFRGVDEEYFTVDQYGAANGIDNTIYFKGKANSEVNQIGTYLGNGGYNEIKDKDGNLLFALDTSTIASNTKASSYLYILTLKEGKLVSKITKRISGGAVGWECLDYIRGTTKFLYLDHSNVESTFEITHADFNEATSGSTFNFTTNTSNLNLTNAVFRYTNKEDEKGYILSSENITATIPLSGVSDGEKWIGKEESGTYIFDNMEPEFNSDGTVTRVNYDENGLDEFDVVGYTGNGSTQTIKMPSITSGVDFVWIKGRDYPSFNNIFDSIRGINKRIYPNSANAEDTRTSALTSFNSNSFELGGDPEPSSTGWNANGRSYIAWCASLPNHTPSNTNGTITSETKANGFMSAISYTGTGVNGTVGMGIAAEFIIIKDRDNANDWFVMHKELNKRGWLNQTSSFFDEDYGNSFDEELFKFGNSSVYFNGTGNKYIAYAFSSIEGKCKVGVYGGTGTNGNKIECGFEPAFVMIKRIDSSESWCIADNIRAGSIIVPNSSVTEYSGNYVKFHTDGFSVGYLDNNRNASGGTYIYLAIAKTTYTKTQATTPTSFLKHPVLVVDEKPQSINTDKKLPENVMKDTLFKGTLEVDKTIVNNLNVQEGLIGVGQTLQDLKSQRSEGITYINDTGRPIFVIVTGVNGGNGAYITFYLNNEYVLRSDLPNITGTEYQHCTMLVPNGSTYMVDFLGNINSWYEIR